MDEQHLQRGKAAAYHSHDFEFESIVPDVGLSAYLTSLVDAQSACGGSLSEPSPAQAMEAEAAPLHCTSGEQAGDWDEFHSKTHGRFFKPRLFLLLEFPALCALPCPDTAGVGALPNAALAAEGGTALPGSAASSPSPSHTLAPPAAGPRLPAVWEVGCGAGSNVLPLLHHTEQPLRVFASDYSPAAVQALREHGQFDADRCSAFVLDVVKGGLGGACREAANEYPAGVQAVTATFLLSAIHPDEQTQAMRNIGRALAPGGLLCFRDYGACSASCSTVPMRSQHPMHPKPYFTGIFDHAMMRFKPDALQQGGAAGALFRRADGTLAHYFALGTCFAPAQAGFTYHSVGVVLC